MSDIGLAPHAIVKNIVAVRKGFLSIDSPPLGMASGMMCRAAHSFCVLPPAPPLNKLLLHQA